MAKKNPYASAYTSDPARPRVPRSQVLKDEDDKRNPGISGRSADEGFESSILGRKVSDREAGANIAVSDLKKKIAVEDLRGKLQKIGDEQNAAAPKKKQSFNEAFAAARKEMGAGKTFEWNGKKYTTDRADDKKKGK